MLGPPLEILHSIRRATGRGVQRLRNLIRARQHRERTSTLPPIDADLSTVDMSQYDFIDFGASNGGSVAFAIRALGGKRGLGIDIDPEKVRLTRGTGLACLVGDVTALPLPTDCVRFVVLSHLLEHLPSIDDASAAIGTAVCLATEFVFIQGPYFDADDYLERHDLRPYWSHWSGHPTHLRIADVERIVADLGISEIELRLLRPVRDSSDDCIHPVSSPKNQHAYDADVHPPRSHVAFDRQVWREFVLIASLDGHLLDDRVRGSRAGSVPASEAERVWRDAPS